jgi:hypothetical protein
MATTTNYSFPTPDDTALVKDGASAIRSLGTAVDTTVKNLNPSTTLGDIEYRSSTANTNTRLGIGTTGQILTVAGGVPSWATPASTAPALNEQVFTASGTFTVPTGVTKLWVEILGGGGGGARNNTNSSGGGNAGARINQQFTVTPAAALTVTIGAGGAQQTVNGNGNDGTSSSFNGTSSSGGKGGIQNTANSITGAATTGGSSWGIGGVNGTDAGANSGAGGGGGPTGGSGAHGGAGGSGIIIVRWLS